MIQFARISYICALGFFVFSYRLFRPNQFMQNGEGSSYNRSYSNRLHGKKRKERTITIK